LFFISDDCGSWLTLASSTRELNDDFSQLASQLSSSSVDTANENGIDLTVLEQRHQSYLALSSIFRKSLPDALSTLQSAFSPFQTAYAKFDQTVTSLQSKYNDLRKSYEQVKAELDRIFGIRFDHRFPQNIRQCNASCGCGLYPSTADGRFTDFGIDLLIPRDQQVVSPFSGLARLANSSDSMADSNMWAVQLFPSDFSLNNYELLIDNIATVSSLSQNLRYVKVGEPIGWSRGNGGCGMQDFIHVAVKERSESREKALFVDPTIFLQPIRQVHVTSSLECNDYTIVYKGEVVKRGMLVPLSSLDHKQSALIRSGVQHSFPNIKSSFAKTGQPSEGSSQQKSISEQLNKYDWPTASSGARPVYPKSWEDPVSVVAPTTVSRIDSLTVEEVKSILENAGTSILRNDLDASLLKLAEWEAMQQCTIVNELSNSELQDWLRKMKRDFSGTRFELIERLMTHPNQGCIGLELSLIKGNSIVYTIDSGCLAVTACVPLTYGFLNIPTLVKVKHNPCGNNLTLTVGNWSNTILTSLNFSYEVNVSSANSVRVYLDGTVHVSHNQIEAFLTVQLCDPSSLDCSPPVPILTQGVFNATCGANQTSDYALETLTLRQLDGRLRASALDTSNLAEIINELQLGYVIRATESTYGWSESFVNEFPQPYDLVMEGVHSLSFPNQQFFEYQTTFVVSTVPVTFKFGARGNYAAAFDISLSALKKKVESTMVTSISADMYGYARQGNLQYSEVSISGKLIEALYPINLNVSFSKWPLEVGSKMDLTLVPTNLLLTTKTIRDAVSEKRTVYSKDLWSYQTPALDRNMFDYTNHHHDLSPPNVDSIFSDNPEEQTDKNICYVRQLPGRSFRDPAYEIAVSVSDDISSVKMSYFIGTIAGGNDALEERLIRGSMVTVPGSLINGVWLYFTFVAENLQGVKSYGTCEIPSYDITPPTGWILPPYHLSSHPSFLSAVAMVTDDSPLQDSQLVAVGLGAGHYGDQQLAWSSLATSQFSTEPDTSLDPLKGFGHPQDGRLPVSPVVTSTNTPSATSCAKQCLELVDPKCLSFDYDKHDKLCLLHDQVLEIGSAFTASDGSQHYIRLGSGSTTELSWSDFRFEHNQLYYINIKVTNKLGYTSVISSQPVLVDLTPPSPGLIKNAISDERVVIGCPDVFTDRCINPSSSSRARHITDGIGSRSVFLGQTPLEESAYSKATHYIAANWDGFHDVESGIYGYLWCVGSAIGSCDIYEKADPQTERRETDDLTNVALAYPTELKHGQKYYVTVEAVNNVVHGGALVTAVRHSTPLVIDTTPPVIDGVRVESFDSSTGYLSVQLNASDAESGLSAVYLGLGSSTREVDLMGWTAVNYTGAQVAVTVMVADGQMTYVQIKATNRVDLTTTSYSSQALFIDRSGPSIGAVNDGQGEDIDYQYNADEICANWKGFVDPHSGISSYKVSIGTIPGTGDVMKLTEVGSYSESACFNVTLIHDVTYYTTVVATHGGTDMINSTSTSDGVLVDSTDPINGTVQDGTSPRDDLDISSDPTLVAATWSGFSDSESDIALYNVKVIKQGNSESTSKVVGSDSLPSDSVGFEWSHIHFTDGDQVHVSVTAVNGAGREVTAQSDGFLVDTTPPILIYLRDGLDNLTDVQYQTNKSIAKAVWEIVDSESGIQYFEVALLQLNTGSRMRVWPPVTVDGPNVERLTENTTSWTKMGLELVSGGKYVVSVTAVNNAGLIATHETDGFVVDEFPPQVQSVDILPSGQDSGDIPVDRHGNILITSTDVMLVGWSGLDDETKIVEYLVNVLKDSGNTSVTAMGGYVSMGLRTTAILEDLSLMVGDPILGPFYRVCVKAVDASGNISPETKSKRIRVISGDSAGIVRDGPDPGNDLEFQRDTTSITATFDGFVSESCEIDRYEWAIGYAGSEAETLQSFKTDGLVVTNHESTRASPGAGRAQALLPGLRETARVIYVTVRAVTVCGNEFQATSNGIRIDTTPADISFMHVGTRTSSDANGMSYHNLASSLSASWQIRELESRQAGLSEYRLGTYPGGDDLHTATSSVHNTVHDGSITPGQDGLPHYFTVSVWNEAGWKSEAFGNSVIYDTSRPSIGSVSCPLTMMSSNATLSCSWSGFCDTESGVDYFEYAVGYHKGDGSVLPYTRLPHTASSLTVRDLNFDFSKSIYVTVKATNLVGLSSLAFSSAVQVDATPPAIGTVQVLSDVGYLNYLTMETAERYADGCLTITDYVYVKWSGFEDVESGILRYEVGLGRTMGSEDIHTFTSVSPGVTNYAFNNLDLSHLDSMYVTVRAFNTLGLHSSATSGQIHIAPTIPSTDGFIYDGSNPEKDSEYTNSVHSLAAIWYLGNVCPTKTSEWEVKRGDGHQLQTFYGVDSETSEGYLTAMNNQLSLEDGRIYSVVTKSTDVAGRIIVQKSNGVTVNTRPLRPGNVRDGVIVGNDIDFQMSGNSMSANWDSFGDGSAPQTIIKYEAAIGVDRRYPATRSNIVPFVSVGMNTTYTFRNLELTARTVRYYFTVRAHSISGATVETTSDGLFVGYIEGIVPGVVALDRFQSSIQDITAHWSDFESENVIERYDFAAGTVKANETMLLLYCDNSEASYSSLFDVSGFQSVSKDTSVTLTGLTLEHGQEYFVTVRAIDRAGHCSAASSERGVIIDITPPEGGQLYAGFAAETVTHVSIDHKFLQFSSDSSHVTVSWWGFVDGESEIESYVLGLYRRPNCSDNSSLMSLSDTETASQVVEDIVVFNTGTSRLQYTFSALNLSPSTAYVVQVDVKNKAGLKFVRYSQNIVIDTGDPVGGDVKDGGDWSGDRIYQSNTDRMDGVFTHILSKPWYNGNISTNPCPSAEYYDLQNDHSRWLKLEQTGLLGVPSPFKQNLEYQRSQVKIGAGGTNITLLRLKDRKVMISGAYSTTVDVTSGSSISFSLKAGKGTQELAEYAITSAVFWDGPESSVGDFALNTTSKAYRGFGLQLRPAYNDGTGKSITAQLLLWSRFANDSADVQIVTLDETTDLTAAFHDYSFHFDESRTEWTGTDYTVTVKLDGIRIAVMHGLPAMISTRLIFHLWNRDGSVPAVTSSDDLPTAVMYVRDVKLSKRVDGPCDHGLPFYDWTSPIVEFHAGVGSRPLQDDVSKFKLISRPCRACVDGPCVHFGCQTNCTGVEPKEVSFNLDKLTLLPYANLSVIINTLDPTLPPLDSSYSQPATYFLTVKAVAASGRITVSSSNGVVIDITPPLFVSIEHIDTDWKENEPAIYQKSNNSIAARWKFIDPESFISEYRWAIGSSFGAVDIQSFQSVGLLTFAVNSSLEGVIQDNNTYYASVMAINGAGLSAVANSNGVTYIARSLNETFVKQSVDTLFKELLVMDVNLTVTANLQRSRFTEKLGLSWRLLSGKVETIYWIIGTLQGMDDILPEIEVGFAGGTDAVIDGGVLILAGRVVGNMSEFVARAKGEVPNEENFFRLEPGRINYHLATVCDLSHQCVEVVPLPIAIIRDQDALKTSTEGENLVIILKNFDENSTITDATDVVDKHYEIQAETSGGMELGGSLAIGFLSFIDLKNQYSTEIPFVSNPFATMLETARHLAGRFTELSGPSFYVTVLGQDELQGPLKLNVSFDTELDFNGAYPELLYWDYDSIRWIEVSASCDIENQVNYEEGFLIAYMCSRHPISAMYSMNRKRRATDNSTAFPSTNATSFLGRETQFVVARILNHTVNTKPSIILPRGGISVTEGVGTGAVPYPLSYTDLEKDNVAYSLTSLPRLGKAFITPDGKITYTPCADCIGTDEVTVRITEIPFGENTALYDEGELTISVWNINDHPHLFFLGDGQTVYSSLTISSIVEANRTVAAQVARVAAYDFDGMHDDLRFSVGKPQYGSADAVLFMDAVGPSQAFPVDWNTGNLSAGHFVGELTFIAAHITYVPSSRDFTGSDEFSVSVRDAAGLFSSDILIVRVTVLTNLCENNGLCGGSPSDPNCTDNTGRLSSFDGYSCECLPGFNGSRCEIEINPETAVVPGLCPDNVPIVYCESNPCEHAYCPSHSTAVCRPNYCGSCTAEWFVGETQVKCSASSSSVCNRPVNSSVLFTCFGVDCPCPGEQATCPADSVYALRRISDCCVEWECVCPSGSCPNGMSCGQGVQPSPFKRGHGSPGWCCPNFDYEDEDECLLNTDGCSHGCQNTPYSFYCTCPDGLTLAADKRTCGVCKYDGREYKLGDRAPFQNGTYWCTCMEDSSSLERWHCVAAPDTTGCLYNGVEYSVGEMVDNYGRTWSCKKTDFGIHWN
jgi:hypothetical protein